MQKFEIDELVAQATASGRDFNTELCRLAAKKRQNQIVAMLDDLKKTADEDLESLSDNTSDEARGEESYLSGKTFVLFSLRRKITEGAPETEVSNCNVTISVAISEAGVQACHIAESS